MWLRAHELQRHGNSSTAFFRIYPYLTAGLSSNAEIICTGWLFDGWDGNMFVGSLLLPYHLVVFFPVQIRRLELEKSQQKLLLESLQQRHQEDLELIEKAHRYWLFWSRHFPKSFQVQKPISASNINKRVRADRRTLLSPQTLSPHWCNNAKKTSSILQGNKSGSLV